MLQESNLTDPQSVITESDDIKFDFVKNTIPKNSKEVVVDLLSTSEFTEEHVETVRELMDWKRIYPELYGDKLPLPIKFVDFGLGNHSDIDIITQKYRRSGAVKKASKTKQIRQNIERNGYKLKYPAVAWFEWRDPSNKEVITGNTRGDIITHSPFNMPNCVVAWYAVNTEAEEARGKKFTDEEIRDALDTCGLRFNSIHDPANPVSPEDVKHVVKIRVDRWIVTNGQAGVANTIDSILNAVDECCGEGVFQPNTRMNLALEIYNGYHPSHKVLSWSSKTGQDNLQKKLNLWKWVNTDKVKYIPHDCEMINYVFVKAVAMSAKHPEAEIRIVLHTGTLSGNDLHSTYRRRISKFMLEWEKLVENVCSAFYGVYDSKKKEIIVRDKEKNNIKIYGVFPALEEFHNLEKPLLIKENTSMVVQSSNGYSFNYLNPNAIGQLNFEDEESQEIS